MVHLLGSPGSGLYSSYFISGASSGIGRALALELAHRARAVNAPLAMAVAARREKMLDELAADVKIVHPRTHVKVVYFDAMQSYEATVACIEACHAELGPIHCFITCAGTIGPWRRIGDESDFYNDWDVAQTNFLGNISTIDAAVRYIKSHHVNKTEEQAHIVAISSIASILPWVTQAVYSATKAGLDRYLAVLTVETAGQGIHVSAIQPGFVDTRLTADMPVRFWVLSPERCAQLIANKIQSRAQSAIVPWWPWAILARLVHWMPMWLVAWVFSLVDHRKNE